MRNNRLINMVFRLMAVMALSLFCFTDASAYSIKQTFSRISLTCGEALTTGNIVAVKAADGYGYKAKADDATLRPAVGIVGKGCSSGGTAEVITYGIVTGWSSLTKGAPGFLSATAGLVTQSSPAYSQQLGIAVSATDYLLNPLNYFDTSAITALGVLAGATPIILDGATADGTNRITVSVTDPTAARTYTFPDVSGTLAFTSGVGAVKTFTIIVDSTVLTSADCGKIVGIGTDAKTITLPATVAGCEITVINTGASGNNIVELIPNASDKVLGATRIANGTVLTIAGADGEHILNTKATAVRGDFIRLLGDGVDGWYIVGSAGIWAEATP